MTATISQVRTGLATSLGTITGLHVRDYIPDQIIDPLAVVAPSTFTYHAAMQGGLMQMEFSVMLIVSRVSDRVAQSRLDGFASYSGASSVRAAVESDPSLGGIVSYEQVVDTVQIGTLDQNGSVYLTMEFTVEVHS
jgi:hypothetical protein